MDEATLIGEQIGKRFLETLVFGLGIWQGIKFVRQYLKKRKEKAKKNNKCSVKPEKTQSQQ